MLPSHRGADNSKRSGSRLGDEEDNVSATILNNHEQYDLLSDQPIARNADPDTSHLAAEFMNRTGKRATQQRQIFQGVRNYPDHTSAELAKLITLDRYVVARRLPELRDAKLVVNGASRKCRATGRQAMIWLPK